MSLRPPIQRRPVQRRLNRDDVLADDLLAMFSERFKLYRSPTDRARILAGIEADRRYGKMTVRDALVFVLTLAAVREWQRSHMRIRKYNRARQLSKFANNPPWYYPEDVKETQRKNRKWERNRIEAFVALGFARRAGYGTHSRALWRTVERAILTDGLGASRTKEAPTVDDVDDLFELIRGRLNYWSTTLSRATVEALADEMFSVLARRMHRASFGVGALYILLHAKHREA